MRSLLTFEAEQYILTVISCSHSNLFHSRTGNWKSSNVMSSVLLLRWHRFKFVPNNINLRTNTNNDNTKYISFYTHIYPRIDPCIERWCTNTKLLKTSLDNETSESAVKSELYRDDDDANDDCYVSDGVTTTSGAMLHSIDIGIVVEPIFLTTEYESFISLII